MYRMIVSSLASLVLVATVVLSGCDNNPIDPGSSKISTGASVDLATQNVSSSGGTVMIDKPGDPLNGMKIDVPNGAYSDARTFDISCAPITGHEFGSDFNVLTPLIAIDNGGGYSDDPMTITIPVQVPEGHFAMGFLYNEATGTLEGLPLVYADRTQIKVLTRNLSSSGTSGFRKGSQEGGTRSSILISSTDAATLDGTFDSDFKMGEDNFQFANWGSYIEPKGHCGGQSIAAMWYYSAKKKNGSPGLYGLFDNDGIDRTPDIWYDDMDAFRFCSIVQQKMKWTNLEYYYDHKQSWDRDLATYRAIAFAIRETETPQCLYVSNFNDPKDPTASAHAILAYRTSNGTISVCDPNFPTDKQRDIIFNKGLGDFEPYYSGANARSTGRAYFNIYCANNSALVDYDEMAALWNNVLDGTIGDDLFPDVRLKVRDSDNDYVPLVEGMKIPSQVTLDVSADGFEPRFRVFEFSTGEMISDNERDFKLSPGKHRLGVYYKGPDPDPESEYIGFRWVMVEVEGETLGDAPEGLMYVRLNLKIDGIPIPPDSLFLPRLSIVRTKPGWGPVFELRTGIDFGRYSSFNIRRTGWKGVGTSLLGDDGLQNRLGTNCLVLIYPREDFCVKESNPGTLVVTRWSDGRVDGTFALRVHLSDDTPSITVEGDFHYPP